MNHTPASGGLDGRSEFIAQSVQEEAVVIGLHTRTQELLDTRRNFLQVIHRVHNTYHGQGVSRPGAAKPPWEQCHRTTCRLAQQVLLNPEGEVTD